VHAGPFRAREVGEDTIRRLQRGDVDAIGEIDNHYGARIFTICRRMLGNDADAEDATQDVFVRLIDKVASYAGRSRFSTWLFRLTVNHTLGLLRARRRRHTSELSELVESDLPTPEQAASLAEERALVDRLLLELSPDQRAVVVLREIEGLSYSEIGEALDLPIGTVTSRLLRGRERLMGMLAGVRLEARKHG